MKLAGYRRLIESDFPIATVSGNARSDRSGGTGHPASIHTWWARRPISACRAVAMALLVPDPTDERCPREVKEALWREFFPLSYVVDLDDDALRDALLQFLGRLSEPTVPPDARMMEQARRIVKIVAGDSPPVLVDPFAGGGSIPIEGQRLGMDVWASDLNPVAFVMLQSLLRVIPEGGLDLAARFKRAGEDLRDLVRRDLDQFYGSSKTVAYLWCREIQCESPNCGIRLPLLNNLWLRKKSKRLVALRYHVSGGRVVVEPFHPESQSEVQKPIISGARATCPNCQSTSPAERVRDQLRMRNGGTRDARMIAVVELSEKNERVYRCPNDSDIAAHARAAAAARKIRGRDGCDLDPIPDEDLPPQGTLGFRVQRYGIEKWRDLFVERQLLLLATLSRHLSELEVADDVRLLLAVSLSKCVRHWNTGAKWHSGSETVAGAFGMQTVPMSWMWPESFPWASWAGNFQDAIDSVAAVVENGRDLSGQAQVAIADAANHPLPDQSADIWFTDPPYYDAVPYSDLSDFFYVWLKRFLPLRLLPRDPFDETNQLTPKAQECVENPVRDASRKEHDRSFFEERITLAFSEGRRILREDGIGCVVFAHKSTEGWEALLGGLIRSGWVVTASWPLDTERGARLRARESAALASSIHLILRPRSPSVGSGDWAHVTRELPKKIGTWMKRLSAEGVRGADLVFACIGPALEIFSRYSIVEMADGREVTLADYLERVWEVVGRSALEQVLGTSEPPAQGGGAVGLEQDARLTALFLWTLESTANGPGEVVTEDGEEPEEDAAGSDSGRKGGRYSLPFDIVRRFAQPLGIHLETWEGRVVETEKGIVKLLSLSERSSHLLPEKSAEAVAVAAMQSHHRPMQTKLFSQSTRESDEAAVNVPEERPPEVTVPPPTTTTLDRIHTAMLLQDRGHSGILHDFLDDEIHRGPQFLRLANALSALYPKDSEERRLLDAVLLAVPKR